ncbi:hypothetical protein ACU21_00415 [Actinobaculum suis]|nr:hypothetical protein ACU20_00420 [Actinobaculum suis]OCA95869.1 hypothetical protein ACU21_00415 [Actinobaculum suis]
MRTASRGSGSRSRGSGGFRGLGSTEPLGSTELTAPPGVTPAPHSFRVFLAGPQAEDCLFSTQPAAPYAVPYPANRRKPQENR